MFLLFLLLDTALFVLFTYVLPIPFVFQEFEAFIVDSKTFKETRTHKQWKRNSIYVAMVQKHNNQMQHVIDVAEEASGNKIL